MRKMNEKNEVKLYKCHNSLTRETFQAEAWVGETQERLQIWKYQAG